MKADAVSAVKRAFFESDLWFVWTGDELHIANSEGRLARDAAAELAVRTLTSLPTRVRMALMGMERDALHPHLWKEIR